MKELLRCFGQKILRLYTQDDGFDLNSYNTSIHFEILRFWFRGMMPNAPIHPVEGYL